MADNIDRCLDLGNRALKGVVPASSDETVYTTKHRGYVPPHAISPVGSIEEITEKRIESTNNKFLEDLSESTEGLSDLNVPLPFLKRLGQRASKVGWPGRVGKSARYHKNSVVHRDKQEEKGLMVPKLRKLDGIHYERDYEEGEQRDTIEEELISPEGRIKKMIYDETSFKARLSNGSIYDLNKKTGVVRRIGKDMSLIIDPKVGIFDRKTLEELKEIERRRDKSPIELSLEEVEVEEEILNLPDNYSYERRFSELSERLERILPGIIKDDFPHNTKILEDIIIEIPDILDIDTDLIEEENGIKIVYNACSNFGCFSGNQDFEF